MGDCQERATGQPDQPATSIPDVDHLERLDLHQGFGFER